MLRSRSSCVIRVGERGRAPPPHAVLTSDPQKFERRHAVHETFRRNRLKLSGDRVRRFVRTGRDSAGGDEGLGTQSRVWQGWATAAMPFFRPRRTTAAGQAPQKRGQFRVRVVSTLPQRVSKPRTDRTTKSRRRPCDEVFDDAGDVLEVSGGKGRPGASVGPADQVQPGRQHPRIGAEPLRPCAARAR
jgi:hypothetical protein